MKKIQSLLVLLFMWGTASQAQISDDSEPRSFSPYFEQVIERVRPLSTTSISSLDMAKAQKEIKEGKGVNYFARPIFVDFGLKNAGQWEELPNGDGVWRIRVQSPGAVSLHALFDDFYLPTGGRLYTYNPQHTQVNGGYTEANNHASREFSVSPIQGDEIIIEYFEPQNVRGQGKIHIYRIEYAYQPLVPIEPATDANPRLYFGFGTSQACHKNVNCSEGDTWQTHKRSVVQMLMAYSDGTSACTGALIQNDQGKPYVLSAWHCQDTDAGVTTLYNQWNFAFNWEAPTCTNPSSLAKTQTLTGCVSKIAVSSSDYFLFELNNTPPSNYNVYYAGWDRSGTNPTSVTGIHHPAADIKKISVNTTNAVTPTTSGNSFSGGSSPLVISAGNLWSFLWNVGTTEGGSSGSPLFDQNGRVIGTLTGGSSSCTNMTGGNYYGRMSSHWAGLQPFLSSTDANRVTMEGFDPNAASVNTGVTTITSTVSPCDLTNNVPVKLTIRNSGAITQTNLPYSWTLTHTSGTQTGNGTVASLAGLTNVDVTINVNMPNTGTYTLTARTNAVGDVNPGDDSKQATFTNTSATTPSSNITFAPPADVVKMTINFTKGNGEGRLVLLKESNSFSLDDLPVQGTSYSANFNFKQGAKIGDAYVVYKGSGNSAPILEGLTVNANYHVAIIEYSCTSPVKYLLTNVTYGSYLFTANERNILSEGIKVYPNPAEASKEIRVELSNLFVENSTWELQTLQGQTLQVGGFEKKTEGLSTSIQPNKHLAGMYLLRVKSGKGVAVKKIIIK